MKPTPHASDCGRIFNRYDADCARCQELSAGAAPRPGWTRTGSLTAKPRNQDSATSDFHAVFSDPSVHTFCKEIIRQAATKDRADAILDIELALHVIQGTL